MILVGLRINDWSRIDRRLGRDDDRLGRCHDHGLGRHDHGLGRHDRRRGDHDGIGGHDVMRKRDRCRRQTDNPRRKAKSAVVVVVVMMMSPREYACRSRQRKSHD